MDPTWRCQAEAIAWTRCAVTRGSGRHRPHERSGRIGGQPREVPLDVDEDDAPAVLLEGEKPQQQDSEPTAEVVS